MRRRGRDELSELEDRQTVTHLHSRVSRNQPTAAGRKEADQYGDFERAPNLPRRDIRIGGAGWPTGPTRRRLERRLLWKTLFGLAVALRALAPAAANAQFATLDLTNLIQNTSTALNTAQQVKATYDLLRNSAKQLEYEVQNLQRMDPSSFQGLLNTFQQGTMTYATLRGAESSIGYQAESVKQSFETLFPSLARAQVMHPSQYPQNRTQRQSAAQAAAYTAMTAQANDTQLRENQAMARQIALKSQTAPGQVAQTQLQIEAMIVLHRQLDALTRMQSASQRVEAIGAAEAATNSMMATEMSRRAMVGYRDRGSPPPPASRPRGR
jgi:P-type conjugative transfer protein TrbJ